MVVIETVINTQIIYLLQFQTNYYSDAFSVLRNFTYVFSNIQYYMNRASNLAIGNSSKYIGYSSSNWFFSMIFLASILNVSLILYGLTKFLIRRYYGKGIKSKQKSNVLYFLIIIKDWLQRVLFVVTVSFSLFIFLQSVDKCIEKDTKITSFS